MASGAEDLPSCSKMNTSISADGTKVGDTIINKFPVVLLTKLDLEMTSVKLNTEDLKLFEENQKGLPRKSTKKSDVKKSSWNDDDAPLSDVSVSVSDGEEMGSENKIKQESKISSEIKKRGSLDRKSESGARVSTENKKDTSDKIKLETSDVSIASIERDLKNEKVSSTQKPEIQGKEIKKESAGISKKGSNPDLDQKTSPRITKHKASKEATEVDDSSFKKPKLEDTVEKMSPNPVKSTKDQKFNTNARYKLALGPFTESALESEAFRKFINLAADCVVSFVKKKTAFGSMNGNVELFFGDFVTLQSAMQRLAQLSVLVDKLWVKGCITCMEIIPLSKDQRKTDYSAKLYFELCTEKREKLQQLVSNRGRKKEDTKRKCVQLRRIPSTINEEMLSLLFPFSLSVKISDTGSSQNDIKGPVEIEFESQEWADAVMACFTKFSVSTKKTQDKLFIFDFKHVSNAPYRSPVNSSVPATSGRQKQITSGASKGNLNQRGRTQNQVRSLLQIKNLAPVPQRKFGPSSQRITDNRGLLQNRNDQRKRTFIGARFEQRGLENRDLAVKRIRLDNAAQARELARVDRMRSEVQSQHAAQSDANTDVIRQIALAKGLDPNNPDVVRVLEMQAHLEKLQTLALHQRAEANSLGLMGVSGQQVVNEHQLQVQQKVLALKQAQEETEVRRYQEAVQAQNLRARGFDGAEQVGSLWPPNESVLQNWEIARRREEEDRMKQEEYRAEVHRAEVHRAEVHRKEIIADRQKQLEELELRSRHERATHFPVRREGYRGNDTNPNLASKYLASAMGDAPGEFAAAGKIKPFRDAPATGGLLGAAPLIVPGGQAGIGPGKRDKDKNLYAVHDDSGVNNRGRRLLEKNVPRNKPLMQHRSDIRTPQDPTPSSRPTSRADRLKPSPTNLGFRQRAQDNRKLQGTTERSKFSGRQSRWDTDGDAEDLNTVSQIQMKPDRNDRPLDFNRPTSRLTTEQAFKQDIERTRAVLSSHVDPARGRTFNPKPLLKPIKPLLEEVRDKHGLPVQFGKNAPKKVPKELEDERRRNVEMNLNMRENRFSAGINDRNARNFGSANAFGESWDTGLLQRGKAGNEEFDDNFRGSNVRASRGGMTAQRGGISFARSSSDLPTSGIVRDDQRSRMFQRAQNAGREPKNLAAEKIDALNDVQWRRNNMDQPRSLEIASNRKHDLVRGQGGHVWQEARERHGYDHREVEEHYYPEGEFGYENSEWKKVEEHLPERNNSYRVDPEYNERPSQFYENEQHSETARRPYVARDFQPFTRPEEEQVSYEEYGEPGNYTSETGFGNEDAYGVYPARGNFGAGRGGSVLRTRGSGDGRGNVGKSVRGRGALSVKRNIQQHGREREVAGTGRGLLDVPEEYKHIEAAYFGEGSEDVAGEELGQYPTHQLQNRGRNSRVLPHLPPPPLPPLLGSGHGVNFY